MVGHDAHMHNVCQIMSAKQIQSGTNYPVYTSVHRALGWDQANQSGLVMDMHNDGTLYTHMFCLCIHHVFMCRGKGAQ